VDAKPSNSEPKPGLLQKVGQLIEEDRKKWGGMTPGALGRLGLSEVREVFSFGGNIAQPTPHGMYGTLTPGEVAAERRDDPHVQQLEQEPHTAVATKGTLPTPSEIAEASRGSVHGDPQASIEVAKSPSEIAAASRGSVYGEAQQATEQILPSPSDIGRDPGPPQEPQQGQEQAHEQSRER
jgi:hypothetical protein